MSPPSELHIEKLVNVTGGGPLVPTNFYKFHPNEKVWSEHAVPGSLKDKLLKDRWERHQSTWLRDETTGFAVVDFSPPPTWLK